MRAARNKRGWLFWGMLLMLLPILYIASFGPALWISACTSKDGEEVMYAYRPLAWLVGQSPESVRGFVAGKFIRPVLQLTDRNLIMSFDRFCFLDP